MKFNVLKLCKITLYRSSELSYFPLFLEQLGRELYEGSNLNVIPYAKHVAVLQPNCRSDLLPIRGIAIMSLLTLPLSMFGFQWFVICRGMLGVLTQVIVFILLRLPNWLNRMQSNQKVAKDESDNSSSLLRTHKRRSRSSASRRMWTTNSLSAGQSSACLDSEEAR